MAEEKEFFRCGRGVWGGGGLVEKEGLAAEPEVAGLEGEGGCCVLDLEGEDWGDVGEKGVGGGLC